MALDTNLLGRAARRFPALRRIPVMRLLALAEVTVLVRDHVTRLEPAERLRVLELVRRGRGRAGNLSAHERAELTALIAKADPRALLGEAAEKLSPVPLPRRFTHGADRGRA